MSSTSQATYPSTCPEITATQLKRLSDYEPLAKICSSFILELFAPVSEFPNTNDGYDSLPYFIAMAFSLSQLPDANALAALTLLQRLKTHNPTRRLASVAKRNETERLFLSAYIAATKVLSDDRYRLQFWVAVGQNKFSLEELTQMEKEFFEELEWDVRIDDATLAIYQLLVERRRQVDEIKIQDSWKPRSDSMDSQSTSASLETTGSSCWGSSCTEGSPLSTLPPTPSDPAISDPVIAAGLHRMKESEQNLTSLDQRIEELQQKFDSLVASSTSRSQGNSPKSHHRTMHALREKFLHAFH